MATCIIYFLGGTKQEYNINNVNTFWGTRQSIIFFFSKSPTIFDGFIFLYRVCFRAFMCTQQVVFCFLINKKAKMATTLFTLSCCHKTKTFLIWYASMMVDFYSNTLLVVDPRYPLLKFRKEKTSRIIFLVSLNKLSLNIQARQFV